MRIKCPNCQNSMTITLIWEDHSNYSVTHTKEYSCECSCEFEVNFVATSPIILKKPIDK